VALLYSQSQAFVHKVIHSACEYCGDSSLVETLAEEYADNA
jgi:hypothetical protein